MKGHCKVFSGVGGFKGQDVFREGATLCYEEHI